MTSELIDMWVHWQNMSCKPVNKKRLKLDAVIDEDKSVKWNREEVIRLNKEYEDEVARLNTQRNKFRDELFTKIYEYIAESVGNGCNVAQAEVIWNFAYNLGHPYGLNEICNHLDDAIEFATKLLSKK